MPNKFHYIFVGYFYPDGIVRYDLFLATPQIDRTISKETIYSSSQRYNISRCWLADSTASPFATLQLLDYSITLSHTVSSLLPQDILKNGATFQNCRLIATYHLDESRRPASFRASTVFPTVVFILDANTRSCASASLITSS
jgi:hypothetical protein